MGHLLFSQGPMDMPVTGRTKGNGAVEDLTTDRLFLTKISMVGARDQVVAGELNALSLTEGTGKLWGSIGTGETHHILALSRYSAGQSVDSRYF